MLDEAKGLLNETLGILVGAGVEIERKATAYERMMRDLARMVAAHLLISHRVEDKCAEITIRHMGENLTRDGHLLVREEIAELIKPELERHGGVAAARTTDLFDSVVVKVFHHLDLNYVADELRLLVLKKLRSESAHVLADTSVS